MYSASQGSLARTVVPGTTACSSLVAIIASLACEAVSMRNSRATASTRAWDLLVVRRGGVLCKDCRSVIGAGAMLVNADAETVHHHDAADD